MDKTGKYLGIPSDWGQTRKDMFSWILAKVNMKLESWKEKLLSKAGKEILIKAVVQALPQYAMSIFKLPISVCKAIEQRIAAFWWKQNDSRRGMHWKRWEILKCRKDEGGLGFKDLINFNKAMLAKQAWRLAQSPSALWSNILKGLYYPNGDFWKAKPGQRPSWGWRSILIGRDTLEPEVKWIVGDGQRINIWRDRWLPRGVIGGPVNRNDPEIVAELINSESRLWEEPKVQALFDEQVAQQVLSTPISIQSQQDRLIWMGNQSGTYSVKSGYNRVYSKTNHHDLNRATTSYQPPRSLWIRLWDTPIPPKIKFFLWSICQNALPTKENLYKRQILPDPLCPLCLRHPETQEHLFFLCKKTQQIWSDPRLNLQQLWWPTRFG